MSAEADLDQKTFDPTPRRLEEARKKGQVAKSREVPTAVLVLASGAALSYAGRDVVDSLAALLRVVFASVAQVGATSHPAVADLGHAFADVGLATLPIFGVVVAASLVAHLGQTGLLLQPDALMPKLSRVISGERLADLFGPKTALVRLGVAVLKVTFVALVVWVVLRDELVGLADATAKTPERMLGDVGRASLRLLLSAGLALGVVAAIDWVYQHRLWLGKMKMTREEVEREHKEDEGSPQIKARRRRMHREMSLNKVMTEVPKADVVVVNPTHFAVALRYDSGKDRAPRVVAKGLDELALVIRRVAREHGVPILENPPLARALHRKVKVGRAVPSDLYAAVAEVLAYVYRLRGRTARRG